MLLLHARLRRASVAPHPIEMRVAVAGRDTCTSQISRRKENQRRLIFTLLADVD